MSAQTSLCIMPDEILQLLTNSQLVDGSNIPSVSSGHRGLGLLRLPHPRTGLSVLFVSVPTLLEESSDFLLELQSIQPDNERSWFLKDSIVSDGKLLMMTAVDPAFILAPFLQKYYSKTQDTSQFRTADDLLDEAVTANSDSCLEMDARHFVSLNCTVRCLPHICETKEIAPSLFAYRFSKETWLRYLNRKVADLSCSQMNTRSEIVLRNYAKQGLDDNGEPSLLKLGKIKTACGLLSHYLPQEMANELLSSHDLSALDTHWAGLETESSVLSIIPEPKIQIIAEPKKRKAPTQASKGVDKLKKANTNGMAKLSSLFKKGSS